MESVLLDVAGHHRSPATMPGYHRGRRDAGDPATISSTVGAGLSTISSSVLVS